MLSSVEDLKTYLKNKENLFLFGAGKRADRYLYIFSKWGIDVTGILVSKREGNPQTKCGIKVWTLDELEYTGVKTEEVHVLVTMVGGAKSWLTDIFQMPCFKSVLFVPNKLEGVLFGLELKYRYEDEQQDYELMVDYPKMEINQGLIYAKKTKRAIVRFPFHCGSDMIQPLLRFATSEELENVWGELNFLPFIFDSGLSKEVVKKDKVEIYVITSHLDNASVKEIEERGYRPIQVGAALSDIRKGCLTDDIGDNISEKNRNYCECTGLYWMWKNTRKQEYIGLYHYRRRLALNDESIQYIKENSIDIVLGHPQFEKEKIKDFFKEWISEVDWLTLKEKVLEFDTSYALCFEKYEEGYFYFPCNVALWKREWFDKYCAFAFAVADKIEGHYSSRGIIREDRYMGYIFEQLSSLFIMRHCHEMKIACTQIEWTC